MKPWMQMLVKNIGINEKAIVVRFEDVQPNLDIPPVHIHLITLDKEPKRFCEQSDSKQ